MSRLVSNDLVLDLFKLADLCVFLIFCLIFFGFGFTLFVLGFEMDVRGAILATVLLRGTLEGLPGVGAMMTGSYIGGGVNFTALSDAFHVEPTLKASATVADNLNMAIYFLVLMGIAGSLWFRKSP